MNGKEFAGGVIGTALGITGTALQTNEVLETISLIVTILGALVSFVIVPLLNWYRHAKSDGKIDKDEAKEGVATVIEGGKKLKEIADEAKAKSKNAKTYAEKVEDHKAGVKGENENKGGNKNG